MLKAKQLLALLFCLHSGDIGAQDTVTQMPHHVPLVLRHSGHPFVLDALPFAPGTAIRIRTADGRVSHGPLISVSRDTVRFGAPNATRAMRVSGDAIVSVDYKLQPRERRYRVVGAVAVGMLTGALAGAAIGMNWPVNSGCPRDDLLCMPANGIHRANHGLVGMLSGYVGGGILGGVLGHRSANSWKPYASVPR